VPPIKDHPSFGVVMGYVVGGLSASFEAWEGVPSEAFSVSEAFGDDADMIGNDQVAAVPWTYHCLHNGNFQELFPTGRELFIQGMTLVDSRRGDPQLHRYVDWAGVYVQLGLEVSSRIPVTEDEYALGRALTPP
jgi:hypothetical protein